jgi:hypothetical protein
LYSLSLYVERLKTAANRLHLTNAVSFALLPSRSIRRERTGSDRPEPLHRPGVAIREGAAESSSKHPWYSRPRPGPGVDSENYRGKAMKVKILWKQRNHREAGAAEYLFSYRMETRD